MAQVVQNSEKQTVADFFGLDIQDVYTEKQQNTYSVMLTTPETQQKYKECNPYGNARGMPGVYDFSERILVFWDGKKVQPA